MSDDILFMLALNGIRRFLMRVITGIARGKKLITLDGLDVRPTTEMVKEAIFSSIHFDLPGASVLDLFSGSGQLGIEAISRGAKHCVFVDKSKSSIDIIKKNIEACGFNPQSMVLNMDSMEYLSVAKTGIDIALLDPPYREGLITKALPLLDRIMSDNSVVVCEHENELSLDESYGRLKKTKTKRYGKISVSYFEINSEDD